MSITNCQYPSVSTEKKERLPVVRSRYTVVICNLWNLRITASAHSSWPRVRVLLHEDFLVFVEKRDIATIKFPEGPHAFQENMTSSLLATNRHEETRWRSYYHWHGLKTRQCLESNWLHRHFIKHIIAHSYKYAPLLFLLPPSPPSPCRRVGEVAEVGSSVSPFSSSNIFWHDVTGSTASVWSGRRVKGLSGAVGQRDSHSCHWTVAFSPRLNK